MHCEGANHHIFHSPTSNELSSACRNVIGFDFRVMRENHFFFTLKFFGKREIHSFMDKF